MSTKKDEFKSKFGRRLKLARNYLGKNQTEFSKMIGIARDTLSRYEGGKLAPSIEVLSSIVEATDYQFTSDWFLTGFGQAPINDLDVEVIELKSFGIVTGLSFKKGGSVKVILYPENVCQLLDGCMEHEVNREFPNKEILNSILILKKYYSNNEDIFFNANIFIAHSGVNFEPVPFNNNKEETKSEEITDSNSLINIKQKNTGENQKIAGRDFIEKSGNND